MKKILLSFVFMISFVSNSLSATMYVTPSGAGDNSGDSWANAMAYSDWESDLEGSCSAGDIYYLAGGTYTLTSSLTNGGCGGAAANPIQIIGVASGTTNEPPTYSDWAYGTDRPLISQGSNAIFFESNGGGMVVKNIRGSGTSPYVGIKIAKGFGYNLKWETNTSGGEGTVVLSEKASCFYCEAKNASGTAFSLTQGYLYAFNAHDSALGVSASQANYAKSFLNGVVSGCTLGIDLNASSHDLSLISDVTFEGNTTDVDFGTPPSTSDANGYVFMVNSFLGTATTGVTADAEFVGAIVDHNVYSNLTTDTSNVTKGPHDVTSDITLTDPSGEDFTLPDSSAAEGVGMMPDSNIGLVGDYSWNIGADKTDTQSGGGGGGASSYGFSN